MVNTCRKMLHSECQFRHGVWPLEGMVVRSSGRVEWLCKKCRAVVVKQYYKDNPEKRGVVRRRVNKRSYNKNIVKRRAAKSAYGKANPEKRKSWAKRRMEALGVAWELKPGEWPALLRKYGKKCLKCGSVKDITKDHIVPLIKGGRHHISNLQPLCRSCNSSKGTNVADYRPH